jgi:hypothetical protein
MPQSLKSFKNDSYALYNKAKINQPTTFASKLAINFSFNEDLPLFLKKKSSSKK